MKAYGTIFSGYVLTATVLLLGGIGTTWLFAGHFDEAVALLQSDKIRNIRHLEGVIAVILPESENPEAANQATEERESSTQLGRTAAEAAHLPTGCVLTPTSAKGQSASSCQQP